MKVLFVDDEAGIRGQAKIFLEGEDEHLKVETAASAGEALEMLKNGEHEAVVSEIRGMEKDS